MSRFANIFLALAVLTFPIGCGGDNSDVPDWPWEEEGGNTGGGDKEEPTEDNPSIVSLGWTNVKDAYGELPDGINVYSSPSKLQGKAAIAYIAVADLGKVSWDIWSISDPEMDGSDESFRTPSEVYSEQKPAIVINGGFFYASGGKTYSSSLAVRKSKTLCYNINYASEDWVTIYYPTRAAFAEHSDGTFEACWTYYTSSKKNYAYSEPAPNSWSKSPAQVPSATYPVTATTFAAKTAIGGGPLLLRGGKEYNSYVEELFDGDSGIMPDGNHPRTAMGVTADKKMILFVCEGRQMTDGIAGLTTGDVGKVLAELGCTEAINLDGGGSSCMLVNGKSTIKESDGKQRSVGSVVMLK